MTRVAGNAPTKDTRVWSPLQEAIFAWFESGEGHLTVTARAGSGKCLGKGTPVMKYSGEIVPVETIVAGDALMGPDSLPRTVVSTNVGRGPMYKISPVKGDPWTCNDVHVMTLTGTNRKSGQTIDVPLRDHLAREAALGVRPDRNWKLFRVPLTFAPQPVSVDPYLVGLWIGDGTLDDAAITNADPEVVEYCLAAGPRHGNETVVTRCDRNNTNTIRFRTGTRETQSHFSPLRRFFRGLSAGGEKRIPEEYLRNSEEVRLELLAGIIDTDGYCASGCCEISQKSAALADQIVFLSRSLGFGVQVRDKISTIKEIGFSGTYRKISISGDLERVPCRVLRRKFKQRGQVKRVLVTGFVAEPIGDGDYYGFTLDGDGRFLLGDFTVTHNTSTSVEGINRAPEGNIWFAAYNKHIQVEMEKRLENPAAVAKTIHAVGYACIKRKWGDEAQGVDNDRCYRLSDEALADPKVMAEVCVAPPPDAAEKNVFPGCDKQPLVERSTGSAVAAIMNKVREVDPFAFREERALALGKIEDVMAQYELLPEERLETCGWSASRLAVVALHAVKAAAEFKDRRFDFVDMLFLPLVNGWCYPRFDLIVVDECQDMSNPMFEFVRKMLKAHGRIALVGDPMQAMYGFRGADSAAAVRLGEQLGATSLPLNITYRCPQSVVRVAQRMVPDFYAAPGAPEGIVREVRVGDLAVQVQVGDAVLSRVNAPLLRVALDVMLQKKAVRIVGRQIGDALVKLVGKVHRGVAPISDFLESLQDYRDDAVERLGSSKERSAKSKLEKLLDQLEALDFLSQGLRDAGGAPDTGVLVTKIRVFFSEQDPKRCVTLSTCHAGKGLEWDRVFVLRDTLYVYGMRKGEDEERNIEYVAVTRAKKELVWVDGRPGEQDEPPMFQVEE